MVALACLPGLQTLAASPGQPPQGPGHSASWCQTSLTPQLTLVSAAGGPSAVTLGSNKAASFSPPLKVRVTQATLSGPNRICSLSPRCLVCHLATSACGPTLIDLMIDTSSLCVSVLLPSDATQDKLYQTGFPVEGLFLVKTFKEGFLFNQNGPFYVITSVRTIIHPKKKKTKSTTMPVVDGSSEVFFFRYSIHCSNCQGIKERKKKNLL